MGSNGIRFRIADIEREVLAALELDPPIRSRANGEMAETHVVQVPRRSVSKRRSAERDAPNRNGRQPRAMIRIIISTGGEEVGAWRQTARSGPMANRFAILRADIQNYGGRIVQIR
jgi:hypothetical protein